MELERAFIAPGNITGRLENAEFHVDFDRYAEKAGIQLF